MNTRSLSAMWAVIRKELLDISRDRRTLAIALLLVPLLYPLLMAGMGTLAEKRARTQLDTELRIPVRGAEHAPNLIKFLATQNIIAIPAPAELDAAIHRQDHDVALIVAADFAENWKQGRPALIEIVQDSTRRDAEIPSRRVRAALEGYSRQVGSLRLLARGIAPNVAQPINVADRDVATAEAKRGLLLSAMLPYLLILTSFIGGAHLIIDATAGERERQSLEPLLATPVSRGAVVSGKIAAACLLGLLSLLLTLLAFKLSAQLGRGLTQMLDVRLVAIGKMLLILLPMAFIGTTLLTLLSATAKSVKEAQSHFTWLSLLPLVPTFVLMVNPVKTQLWQFTVPFLAQNQLLLKVIRAEPIEPSVWAVYLGSSFALAGLLWYAAVRRYHNESLAVSG